MPTNYYPEDNSEDTETLSSESETSLLPKSMLGEEVKVGDSITLKVVHLYEDEAEVEVVSESPQEEETQETMSPESELDSIGTE